MTTSPAIRAARAFIATVWTGEPPDDADLLAALDRLLAAYHDTPETDEIGTDADAPREDWKVVYDKAAARFPDLGLYPAMDPTEFDSAPLTHDAIDDIADLTGDMQEVLWVAETYGVVKAEAVFRAMHFHWGEHARGLAWLLHHRLARRD